jgi:hypothetical protein
MTDKQKLIQFIEQQIARHKAFQSSSKYDHEYLQAAGAIDALEDVREFVEDFEALRFVEH